MTYDLEAVPATLPVLPSYTDLNIASFRIMTEPVLRNHLARIASFERSGHVEYANAQEGYEAWADREL